MAYVRLKTLTVGYSFPQEWMKKLRVQGLRVYFTGENLFTFDGVKPAIDPEIEIRTVGTRSTSVISDGAILSRKPFRLAYN